METRMNGEGTAVEGDVFGDTPTAPAPSKPDPPMSGSDEGGGISAPADATEEVGTQAAGEAVKEEIEKDLASSDLDLATDPNTKPPPPTPPKTSFSKKFKKGVKKVAKGATTKAKERSGGMKAAPAAKSLPSKPSSTGASGPRKAVPMATHKKGAETANGDVKQVGMNVSEEVAKNVRRFQAKMQLESGEKTSYSDAIGKAVEIALAAE